jgi:alanine racemase
MRDLPPPTDPGLLPAYRTEASDRPTRIRVDLDALSHNLHALQRHAGVPVMAIVKANAYGHGLVPVAKHLQSQGVSQLGVAFVEEGVALRQAGLRVPILVLGGIHAPQVTQFIAHDLEVTVSSIAKLRQVEQSAESMGRKAVIHLKLDTGMERIGVHSENAAPFIEAAVASRWCTVKGVYSHLACSDVPDSPMTREQLQRFLAACAHFDRIGAPMPVRHLANSGGVLHFPETHLDMVRPGIALYGVLPDPASRATVDLRPSLSLVSKVVYFKVVKAGHRRGCGLPLRRTALRRSRAPRTARVRDRRRARGSRRVVDRDPRVAGRG